MTTPTQAQIEAAEDPVDGFLNELEYHKQVKPNATATAALQWAYNEIVRLRALTAAAEAGGAKPLPAVNWHKGKPINYCPECGREEYVLGLDVPTIERCAQVAESGIQLTSGGNLIAAAIRAMKDQS